MVTEIAITIWLTKTLRWRKKGFTLTDNQIRKPLTCVHSVILAMEVQIPNHTVFDMPSLLQAVVADTVLAAAQSIALVFLSHQNPLFSSHLILPLILKIEI